MSTTTTTTTTTTTGYVYDAATVVAAYTNGDVTLVNARKMANVALRHAVRNDVASVGVHADALDALDAAAKTATSTARVITANDYATAIMRRVDAYAAIIGDMTSGRTLPTDVPADMADDVVSIIAGWMTDDTAPTANDDDTATARAIMTARVIGSSDVDAHFRDIVAGTGTTATGDAFTVDPSRVYTYAELASVRTTAYPNGDVSHGAIGARFTRPGATAPAGWSYAAMPSGSRATNGARYGA